MMVSSGPIPHADDLYKYTAAHQERIIRMAESARTDESVRRTTVVDTQTIIIKRGQILQAVIFAACIALAGIGLLWIKTPYGAIFLGGPVIQGINAIVQNVRK